MRMLTLILAGLLALPSSATPAPEILRAPSANEHPSAQAGKREKNSKPAKSKAVKSKSPAKGKSGVSNLGSAARRELLQKRAQQKLDPKKAAAKNKNSVPKPKKKS
jgi:hypothetical protein